jgi:hypothetical protein
MTNVNRIFVAAAIVVMSSSAGFAADTSQFSYGENTVNLNDDASLTRRAVGTGFELNVLPSNVLAIERGMTVAADESQSSYGENTANLNDDTSLTR